MLTLHHAGEAFCSMEEYIFRIPHLLCHSLSLPAPEKKVFLKTDFLWARTFITLIFSSETSTATCLLKSCHEIEKLFTDWSSDHHLVIHPMAVLPIHVLRTPEIKMTLSGYYHINKFS